jgi:hypothetical protein
MRNRRSTALYVLGVLLSVCIFGIINYRHFHRVQQCDDCSFPYGLPFTIYHEGGYAGGAGFNWPGLVGDLILTVLVGIAIGWIMKKIFPAAGMYSTM